ncbi:hypothetical protein HED34_11505 [Vagococcus fluvialis]|uniref:hypothetical protein n=1 Tax=Vagococcus fluvialis TaxID=2738 RepID=UPI001432E6F7|nr:hypothetical protein [Vagococcus fluvialis]NKC60585.1 hypothetical protein [Vagococcus fluvialis]NKD51431.1 hypothetical protein [Vagococcus fluvialis]
MSKEEYVSIKLKKSTSEKLLTISKNERISLSELVDKSLELYVAKDEVASFTYDVEKQIYMLKNKFIC